MESQHSRKDCAVVSHDDLVQNGANDAPVHFYLFGSRTKHLRTKEVEDDMTRRFSCESSESRFCCHDGIIVVGLGQSGASSLTEDLWVRTEQLH